MDGSNSTDPDGTLSYEWVQISGTTVTLSDPLGVQSTFTTPDVESSGTVLTFQLTVTDNGGLESTDTCSVNINWADDTPTLQDLAIVGASSVNEDASANYTAIATFSDGATQTVTDNVNWSEDSSYASIDSNGVLSTSDVTMDETVIITAGYTHDNVMETVQKTVSILDSPPTNLPPLKPVIDSPYEGQVECDLQPNIICEEFSDPDGDIQGQTQWQISAAADFNSTVLDVTSSDQLIELTVPHMLLDANTTYHLRVRFYDIYLEASGWSDAVEFTTLVDSNDANSNGIPDNQEVENSVDVDGNGTSDVDEPENIKTIQASDGITQIGITRDEDSADEIQEIENVQAIDPSTISDNLNRPKNLSFELFAYRLRVTSGATVNVKIHFSRAIPSESRYFMYNTLRGWWDYSNHVTFHADGKSITVETKDGGYGDSDGIENGVIVDPGGFGESGTSSGDTTPSVSGIGSSGGGCFIATTQTNVISYLSQQVSLSPTEFFHKIATVLIEVGNVLVNMFGVKGA